MNSPYLAFIGRILIDLPFAMSGLSKLAAYRANQFAVLASGLPGDSEALPIRADA